MGDHARAGIQFARQFWPQTGIEIFAEVEHHHGRFPQVEREQVALLDAHAAGDASLARRDTRAFDQYRIDLDADAACSAVACCGDDDSAVAASKVEHRVGSDDAGKLANRIQGLLRASRDVSELINAARERPTGPVGRFPDQEDVSCAALEEECTFESGRRALRDLAVTR